MSKLETGGLTTLIPGHGPASASPKETIALTSDDLAYPVEVMGAAVDEFIPFDEAYTKADCSKLKNLPAFETGNHINAHQVYLSMEAVLPGQ